MKCTYCDKEIVLVPSAKERAKKDVTGKSAAYYTALFTIHSECQLLSRKGIAPPAKGAGPKA